MLGRTDSKIIGWSSPELIRSRTLTIESDCYALGMVIYEVLTSRPPFVPSEFVNCSLKRAIINGERPGRPTGAEGAWFTDDLWEMLGLCWEANAKNRPSIEDVLDSLGSVQARLEATPTISEHGNVF